MASITVTRNKQIVGNNCMSYNDKHPTNPVSMRPIRSAIEKTPRVFDDRHRLVPDMPRIRYLLSLRNLPRMDIALMIRG